MLTVNFQVQGIDVRIRSYLSKSEAVSKCLSAYSDTLHGVLAWREDVRKNIKFLQAESPGEEFNFTSEVRHVDRDTRQVEDLFKKYSAARITKQQLLDEFDPERVRTQFDFDFIIFYSLF